MSKRNKVKKRKMSVESFSGVSEVFIERSYEYYIGHVKNVLKMDSVVNKKPTSISQSQFIRIIRLGAVSEYILTSDGMFDKNGTVRVHIKDDNLRNAADWFRDNISKSN